LKLAAQQKPPTKPETGCAAATNTSNNLNNTAAPRYADSEAQNRMDIWIVEHRPRTQRMATDRLTRATKSLVWATGVLALATIALLVVTLSAAKSRAWRYEQVEAADDCGDQTAMMPKRRRTRAQNGTHRIATERRQNHPARAARRAECWSYVRPAPPEADDDPPPF
jgi:hypothetical protein